MNARVALLSDLHVDTGDFVPAGFDADLVVMAGDVMDGPHESPVHWMLERLPEQIPAVFVPGNHDFYGGRRSKMLELWRRQARGSRVHVLYNQAIELAGLRVLGTPLWSGLALSRNPLHESHLKRTLNWQHRDFSMIYQDNGRLWTVRAMLAEHAKALAFLRAELARPGTPSLVVTHWPPHRDSAQAEFSDDPWAPYFVNHLPGLVTQAGLWVHGHVHGRCHYHVGQDPARGWVACNPRGYPSERRSRPPYAAQVLAFPSVA